MGAYADTLLRLAHRFVMSGAPVEVFHPPGTRLTHVTRALRHRDADRAIVAAGEAIPDWSGGPDSPRASPSSSDAGAAGHGTRCSRRHLQRRLGRDAPEALGEQVRRLQTLAHHVLWANPHRGARPTNRSRQGSSPACPIDDFVAGHSLAAFEELTEVVARA